VIIPARNEVDRLPETLRSIAETTLPGVAIEQVIVVDNDSSDATIAIARALGAELGLPLTVMRAPLPGKANAVRLGMTLTALTFPDLDGLLYMDADNATALDEARHFDLLAAPAIWIGSRHLPGSVIESLTDSAAAHRRIMSLGMRAITRTALRLPLSDTQCGFKLIPKPWVIPLFNALRSDDWVFDAELLGRANLAGIPIREVPIHWVEKSGSKVRPVHDTIGSLIAIVRIAWWLLRARPTALLEAGRSGLR
jgi:dolichyl-phosphate beta-glucosyltransferase